MDVLRDDARLGRLHGVGVGDPHGGPASAEDDGAPSEEEDAAFGVSLHGARQDEALEVATDDLHLLGSASATPGRRPGR